MPTYRCLNCPERPQFETIEALQQHWGATHTVPMVETILDPWGERPPKTIKRYELIGDVLPA